jgi:catalase
VNRLSKSTVPRRIGITDSTTTTISSPGDLFRMMSRPQRQTLFDNTARAIGGAAAHIRERHIANCAKADPEYGAGVAAALSRMGASMPMFDDRKSA